MLILGLSGTGKTTTTFRQQLGSLPVQDDFNALMFENGIRSTQQKTAVSPRLSALDPDDEPTIYGGTTRPGCMVGEHLGVNPDGTVDFFDDSDTANGRSTFPLEHISGIAARWMCPPANYMLLLNRNENLIPAVAKLKREQAAAYFMLGETKGTSAGW